MVGKDRTGKPGKRRETVRLGAANWTLLAAAAGVIVAGYALLSSGSTVLAPLLLVTGYAVLIPLGIIR
ncbi:MAG: hypothetical protein ACREKN_02280 [Longimicrobiaceae bacterium]